jgi:hypothetical protein
MTYSPTDRLRKRFGLTSTMRPTADSDREHNFLNAFLPSESSYGYPAWVANPVHNQYTIAPSGRASLHHPPSFAMAGALRWILVGG